MSDRQQSVDDQTTDDDDPNLAGPEGDESEAPEYVSRADFDAAFSAFSDKVLREVQSRTDKADHRLQQRFQSLNATYAQAAEQAVTQGFIKPDQKAAYSKALSDHAMAQAIQGNGTDPANGQDDEGAEDEGEDEAAAAVEQVSAQGERLARQAGLADGDPELAMVLSTGSPEEYYASIKIAGRLKAQRLASSGEGTRSPAKPAPLGRSPAAGAGNGRPGKTNPIEGNNNVEELLDMEWKKIRQSGR